MKPDEPTAGDSGKLPVPHKVLIVDDDESASTAIGELVRDLGYQAVCCNDVAAALEVVRREGIDVVLADYRMPEMTGLDLVWMLREDGCHIPVIMMTGYAGTEDRIISERGDRFTILRKPINPPELRTALQEHLPARVHAV
jgi:CheY-like chemotaxis protein